MIQPIIERLLVARGVAGTVLSGKTAWGMSVQGVRATVATARGEKNCSARRLS